MTKFEVRTTNAVLVYEADGFDQANRLGRDGGRIVLSVSELSDDGEAISTHDPRDVDFGDEEVVVITRAEHDRLVGLSRMDSGSETTHDFLTAPESLGEGEEIVADADGAPSVEPPTPVGPDGQPIAFEVVSEPDSEPNG